jgi:hypothetical protein
LVAQDDNEATRTPHSVFYYALGYTGWVGVALFALLQFAILRLLWRSYRITGQAAGVAWWVMQMVMASFQEGFETPFHAVPFYLLAGITMAPALRGAGEVHVRLARTPDLTGRPVPTVSTGALRRRVAAGAALRDDL